MIARTSVRLPKNLLNRAKRKAATEGRTLSSLIENGLRLLLADTGKAAMKRRIMPRISKADGVPVSKAIGGLMPGVTITCFSSVQEMDDLEYVERMKQFRSD
jgi:hypothetical protein